MLPRKKTTKTKSAPGDDPSSDNEPISLTNPRYAKAVGFFDTGIPLSLYGLWRRDVAQLMTETEILGPQKAGMDHWFILPHDAAGLAIMAPRGMINYVADKTILHAVNILCQDIVKKVRNGKAAWTRAIKAARTAYAAQHPGDPSPPALADNPSRLQPQKQIILSTTTTSKAAAVAGADAGLAAQLLKRLGGLWALAPAYHPYSAPAQGENEPNTAMMHIVCPQLDTCNALPYPEGFTFVAFGWRWQRSKMVTV